MDSPLAGAQLHPSLLLLFLTFPGGIIARSHRSVNISHIYLKNYPFRPLFPLLTPRKGINTKVFLNIDRRSAR
jgi:hypothetical protein